MIVEFTRHGTTYRCVKATEAGAAPPARIIVPFRPFPPEPIFNLELEWVSTDARRMIEHYRPARAACAPRRTG
jgi:hypothetical protein